MNNSSQLPSNKKFGFFFSIIFLFMTFLMFVYQFNEIAKILFILSIIFLAISILIPNILLPLNKAWMKVGFILGTIISPLIIGLIFFVIFTPISFLFKIIRRDELRLKKTNQSTHWRIKKHQDDNQSSFKNQF